MVLLKCDDRHYLFRNATFTKNDIMPLVLATSTTSMPFSRASKKPSDDVSYERQGRH